MTPALAVRLGYVTVETVPHTLLRDAFPERPGLDMALFGDAGNVFSDVDAVKLDKLKTSYGIGFRFNTGKSVFLRMDIAHSHEGLHTFLKFNHVF